jgi:toxin ParE1/3/4
MRPKPVIPRERASRDVEAAVEYYAGEAGEQIASGFIDALENAFGRIASNPATGSPRFGDTLELPGLRTWTLKRYPWLIFYIERPDHIDVWRVLHTRRDIPATLQAPEE